MSLTRKLDTPPPHLQARKRHFVRKRRYADAFSASGNPEVALQLRNCEETQVLACCSDCGKSWWLLNRCRLRVCPLCSYKEALLRGEFLIALSRQMAYPKMITLTMPTWTDDPHEGIQYIRAAFNKLRKHELFGTVKGGAYQIELKQKPAGWHIHIHALIDAPFIPHQRLFTAWRLILHATHVEVDIRAAQDDKAKVYVCKYAAKSADFHSDPANVVAWYLATKGHRLFATFGTWYNAKLEELVDAGKFAPFVPTCPYCKKEQTTFLARDGPYRYGHDLWRVLKSIYVHNGETVRPIESVRLFVDTEYGNHQASLSPERKRQTEGGAT